MEAAVGRIGILARTRGAHREPGHGGERAIVRNAANDREARAAARAVDEPGPVVAVAGIEELAEAVIAGRDVGGDTGTVRAPSERLATIAKLERSMRVIANPTCTSTYSPIAASGT
jgi:hypothetical protein